MREKLLVAWGKLSARYPGRIIAALIILSVIALFSASKLTLKMRWSDLLPFDDPMVQEFDEIQKEYTGTTNSIMVVRGPEKQIKKFADEIVPPIRKMTRYVKRVNYKLEVDFFRTHGLMLSRTPDLKKMVDNKLFADLSLAGYLSHVNDNFEAVYIGDRESLSDKEKEDLAISSLDGLQYWIKTMRVFVSGQGSDSLARVAVSRILIGDPYYISPDKRMLLVIIDPNFDVVDIKSCIASTDSIQVLIDNLLEKFPSVSAGLTGMIPLSRDEMTYANEDMGRSSLLAFLLVIFLFIFSFRMISAPLLAGFNLIPQRVLRKSPTAELKPNQKDEDDLCPYKILDKIIDLYVEKNWDLKRIIKKGIPQDLVFKIVLRIDKNEYKRRLSPPGIKISLPASGKDRKMPITNRFIIKK